MHQEVSATALEADQTLNQVVPLVETWMDTGSLTLVRSQRLNLSVRTDAPPCLCVERKQRLNLLRVLIEREDGFGYQDLTAFGLN